MITGANVHLTEVRAADSEVLFGWINHPDTVRLNSAYRPTHESTHQTWFASLGKNEHRIFFAVRDSSDRLLGYIQLIDVDAIHRVAELTIRLGLESERGRGVGTEAMRLVLDHAWRDLNLNRVWLRVFSDNARAIRAYEKVGFLKEGVLRQGAYINGRFVDVVVMGTLRPPVTP